MCLILIHQFPAVGTETVESTGFCGSHAHWPFLSSQPSCMKLVPVSYGIPLPLPNLSNLLCVPASEILLPGLQQSCYYCGLLLPSPAAVKALCSPHQYGNTAGRLALAFLSTPVTVGRGRVRGGIVTTISHHSVIDEPCFCRQCSQSVQPDSMAPQPASAGIQG